MDIFRGGAADSWNCRATARRSSGCVVSALSGGAPFRMLGFSRISSAFRGELRGAAQSFQSLGDGVAHALFLVVFATDNRNTAHG